MAFKDIQYREPYIPHQSYEDRVVAFIDVLGFSAMVEKTATEEDKLHFLTSALDGLHNKIWEWEADGVCSSFAFTQFSDSIVISALAESADSFGMLMQLLQGAMDLVDVYGILLRGGITRGKLIHDDTLLVGPAMVEAYHLESKQAIYPRIIIGDELKRQFDENMEDYIRNYTTLVEVPGFNRLFKKDDDGWYYLDYIQPAEEYNNESTPEEHLKNLEYLTKKGLNSEEEKVRIKYEWIKKKMEKAFDDKHKRKVVGLE